MSEILDGMLESSGYTVSELTLRLHTLRRLRAEWEKGDIIQVISLLQGIFDDSMDPSEGEENSLIVLADFLQVTYRCIIHLLRDHRSRIPGCHYTLILHIPQFNATCWV